MLILSRRALNCPPRVNPLPSLPPSLPPAFARGRPSRAISPFYLSSVVDESPPVARQRRDILPRRLSRNFQTDARRNLSTRISIYVRKFAREERSNIFYKIFRICEASGFSLAPLLAQSLFIISAICTTFCKYVSYICVLFFISRDVTIRFIGKL